MVSLGKIARWLTAFIVLVAFGMIFIGFNEIYQTERAGMPVAVPTVDTTVKTVVKKDTLSGKPAIRTSSETTSTSVNHSNELKCPACKPYSDDLIKTRYDNAYRLIYTGIFIIMLFMLLPSLKDFSILGLFSVTFRDKINGLKQMNNDTEEALASKPLPPDGANLINRGLTDNKGNEPGKWGGKPESNNRRLSALVALDPEFKGLYIIQLKVTSTDPNSLLKGKIKFHLPATFLNPNPRIFVLCGMASLKLRSAHLFIVGAEADDDMTRLELNLADLVGTDNKSGNRTE
ncbi:MAG: hypothetical protein JWR12_2998 [Mucilaginibacter sp.]|nr:hypothetical protein [Mucilaginibacter sp.]